MSKVVCYVVVLVVDNKKYFLESEDDFCESILYASKWLDRERAEMVASSFEGARVEAFTDRGELK